MALRLNGQSTGYTELNAPDDGDQVVLTMPANDGDSGQYLQTNGTGTLSWQTITVPTVEWTDLGQTDFPNAGSTVTVTGISTNARVIRLVISDLSLNGTNTPHLRMRLGNGSESSTGYDYSIGYQQNNQAAANQGNMNLIHTDFNNGNNVYHGILDIVSSQTHMIASWQWFAITSGQAVQNGVGRWRGDSAIDRINLTTASGFDSGHFAVYTLD